MTPTATGGTAAGEPTASALVTGAARGLGLAVARRLAQAGSRVVLADRDGEEVRAATAGLAAEGLAVRAAELDVTDERAVVDLVAAVDADLPLGAVVNNAGIARRGSLLQTTTAEFDLVLSVTVRAAFIVLREAARAMVARGGGAIVNVASTSSFTASSTPMLAYDTAKGAVPMLTRAAARELAPHGVRVNAVAPGTMDTALVRGLLEDPSSLSGSRIPLGRLGEPAEVAEAVEFLTSPRASYVTGHVLVVDGGWLS